MLSKGALQVTLYVGKLVRHCLRTCRICNHKMFQTMLKINIDYSFARCKGRI